MFAPASLPDLGPPLPATVRLEFDPTLTTALARYADACNHPQELRIGEELETVLLDAARQTFQAVKMPGETGPLEQAADIEVAISLEQSGLRIQTDNIYDRLPAELALEALAVFKDRSGKVLGERPLKTIRRERIILEPTQHRCAYVTMDTFLHDAAVDLSTKFARESRALLDPSSQIAAGRQAPVSTAAQNVAPVPSAPVSPPPPEQKPALSFKATILDENGNLILEGGERITVRVEIANAGAGSANGVSAIISGPPVIISQFPASTLTVGSLQPGESKSVEFSGTVPQAVPPQRVDLMVTVTEASGSATPPAQMLAAMLRSNADAKEQPVASKGSWVNIDRVPDRASGFERPRTFVISIGISAHRDQQASARKYAAMDAELVAEYLRALGGVPAANVRLLQDWKALRSDIEEAILDWLPAHMTPDSNVIVYVAGQVKVGSSGETFLVPYEGGQSAARLYPVKDLLAALGRLKARQIVLIFDGSVLKLDDAQAKGKDPQWGQSGRNIVRLIGTTGFQNSLEPEKLHHGLFTYLLLRGLRGEADSNRDRDVTLGEVASFLRKAVPDAARQGFNHEQQPLIIPSIPSGSQLAAMPLTRSMQALPSSGR